MLNMLKKGDIVLIAVLLILVAAGYFFTTLRQDDSTARIAVIKQDDKVIERIDLGKVESPRRIEVSGEYNDVVLVEKGRIRFEDADCPDKVCVKTGWLERKGDIAVCLPNRTIIKIEGQNDEVDIVAG